MVLQMGWNIGGDGNGMAAGNTKTDKKGGKGGREGNISCGMHKKMESRRGWNGCIWKAMMEYCNNISGGGCGVRWGMQKLNNILGTVCGGSGMRREGAKIDIPSGMGSGNRGGGNANAMDIFGKGRCMSMEGKKSVICGRMGMGEQWHMAGLAIIFYIPSGEDGDAVCGSG